MKYLKRLMCAIRGHRFPLMPDEIAEMTLRSKCTTCDYTITTSLDSQICEYSE